VQHFIGCFGGSVIFSSKRQTVEIGKEKNCGSNSGDDWDHLVQDIRSSNEK
jgi:hypothetical protein